MDKKIVTKVLATFTPKVAEAVTDYCLDRIALHHKELEQTKMPERVSELQGAIAELRKMIDLRNSCFAIHENASKGGVNG